MKIAIACVTKNSNQIPNWVKRNSAFGECFYEISGNEHNPKNSGFSRIINLIKNTHDWIFMIDDDEYIVGQIPHISDDISCVRVCSKTFGPEGRRHTPEDPFGLYNNPIEDKLTKCLVRIKHLRSFDSHWAEVIAGKTVNSKLEECKTDGARITYCDDNFYLNHYKLQSYDDLIRKSNRGSIHQKDKYTFSKAQLETIRLIMGLE